MSEAALPRPAPSSHPGGWTGVQLLAYGMLGLLLAVTALWAGTILEGTLELSATGVRELRAYASEEDAAHLLLGIAIAARPLLVAGAATGALGVAAIAVSIGVLHRSERARQAAVFVVVLCGLVSLGACAWYVASGAEAIREWAPRTLEIRTRIAAAQGRSVATPQGWETTLASGGLVLTLLNAGLVLFLLRSLTSKACRAWCLRGAAAR